MRDGVRETAKDGSSREQKRIMETRGKELK
jgi:hypothetical protein